MHRVFLKTVNGFSTTRPTVSHLETALERSFFVVIRYQGDLTGDCLMEAEIRLSESHTGHYIRGVCPFYECPEPGDFQFRDHTAPIKLFHHGLAIYEGSGHVHLLVETGFWPDP